MKKTSVLVLFLVGVFAVTAFAVYQVKSHAVGQTLSAEAAKDNWGSQKFDPIEFKKGNLATRSAMASGILKSQTFLNEKVETVLKELGASTGYFWNDHVPAYVLNNGWKEGSSTWQLVFLTGRSGYVKKVLINKNIDAD